MIHQNIRTAKVTASSTLRSSHRTINIHTIHNQYFRARHKQIGEALWDPWPISSCAAQCRAIYIIFVPLFFLPFLCPSCLFLVEAAQEEKNVLQQFLEIPPKLRAKLYQASDKAATNRSTAGSLGPGQPTKTINKLVFLFGNHLFPCVNQTTQSHNHLANHMHLKTSGRASHITENHSEQLLLMAYHFL